MGHGRPKRYSARGDIRVNCRMETGAEGARTPNPRIANAVLSQLSYGPE